MAYPQTGFDTYYGDTPWENLDRNQRTVYSPDLMEIYRKSSLFYRLVTYGVNLRAARTGQMVFTQVLDPKPNIREVNNRTIWLPQTYFDSKDQVITAKRYGDKVMLHDYDDWLTYWREGNADGLRNIIRNRVAPHMVASLDLLARNAHLRVQSNRAMFAGGASSFGSLNADDIFEVGVARAVQLQMGYTADPLTNPIVAVVDPAATYSVKNDTTGEWVDVMKYAAPGRLLNYEIGTYDGVRFVSHPSLTLYNCGQVLAQTTVTASISLGDGAPDPETTTVDGVWRVGQAGATHGITVADSSGFTVGDYVTLHTSRPSADATLEVLNGVQFDHANNSTWEIAAIPDGTTLQFTEPVSVEYYQTDLGGGVYAYCTLARPVHASVFLHGPNYVVSGVLNPPETNEPKSIDDMERIWRVAWDAYLEYQIMQPRNATVYFYAGPITRGVQVVNL
jgi:hypothetical protein